MGNKVTSYLSTLTKTNTFFIIILKRHLVKYCYFIIFTRRWFRLPIVGLIVAFEIPVVSVRPGWVMICVVRNERDCVLDVNMVYFCESFLLCCWSGIRELVSLLLSFRKAWLSCCEAGHDFVTFTSAVKVMVLTTVKYLLQILFFRLVCFAGKRRLDSNLLL